MCPIKIEDIKFSHIIDSTKDASTFATARENASNRIRIFQIKDSGSIYVRSGIAETWNELFGPLAESLRISISQARQYVPVYTVNN